MLRSVNQNLFLGLKIFSLLVSCLMQIVLALCTPKNKGSKSGIFQWFHWKNIKTLKCYSSEKSLLFLSVFFLNKNILHVLLLSKVLHGTMDKCKEKIVLAFNEQDWVSIQIFQFKSSHFLINLDIYQSKSVHHIKKYLRYFCKLQMVLTRTRTCFSHKIYLPALQ